MTEQASAVPRLVPKSAELARQSLIAYACAQDVNYIPGKPHAVMGAALDAVVNGEVTRLLILAPPRHGKSRLVSEFFPAYWLGRNPHLSILHSAYSQDLADDFGRKIRGLIQTPIHQGVFPSCRPDPGSDSIRRFHLLSGGGYFAAGAGGPITGRGGHLLLLDDPYKNRQEADSPIIRGTIENWYRSTFRTRLHNFGNKPGAIVIVLTHWHEQDIAGFLQEQQKTGGEKWLVIRLRARAEEDDILGRELGAPLWPEGGFDDDYLTAMELAVGPREWSALFQQRPSAAAGNIFLREDWGWYCPTSPCTDNSVHDHLFLPTDGRIKIAQSWDTAVKKTRTSDWVVGLTGLRHGANLYLLDRMKERQDLPGTIAMIRRMKAMYPGTGPIWVEAKANGPAVVQSLKQEIPGIVEVEPSDLGPDKEARYRSATPYTRAGQVLLPRGARWTHDFIESTAAVPNTDHDDDADAFSQLAIMFYGKIKGNIIKFYAEQVERMRALKQGNGSA